MLAPRDTHTLFSSGPLLGEESPKTPLYFSTGSLRSQRPKEKIASWCAHNLSKYFNFLCSANHCEIDLSTPEEKLKAEVESKLKEHQFLWENVSQRNRNTYAMGAFFVPVSFLIFAYTAIAEHLSGSHMYSLSATSIALYLVWIIFLFRNDMVNGIFINRMKSIEAKLKELKIEYQPLTSTDAERKNLVLKFKFPPFVWGMPLGVLLACWMLLFFSQWKLKSVPPLVRAHTLGLGTGTKVFFQHAVKAQSLMYASIRNICKGSTLLNS